MVDKMGLDLSLRTAMSGLRTVQKGLDTPLSPPGVHLGQKLFQPLLAFRVRAPDNDTPAQPHQL